MSAPDELAEMKRYQWHADLHDYVNCATGEKCVANWVVPASDVDRVIAARDAGHALEMNEAQQSINFWMKAKDELEQALASRDAEITFYRSRVASLDGTILALLSERDEARAEIGRLRETVRSAADLLIAVNKSLHRGDPTVVTAIDWWLAERSLTPSIASARGASGRGRREAVSRFREDIEAIRVMGFWRWLWARTFYRVFQRFAHRHNWHHTTKLGPFEDGSTQQWCQWCGLRQVTRKATTPTPTHILTEISHE